MPQVSALFVLLFSIAAPAQADLYRWVDPETGSVKFSTLPPADPHLSAALLPYTALPAKPSAPKSSSVAALEAELRMLTSQLGTRPSPEQAQAYVALRRQLDLLDPAGARRRAEETAPIAGRPAK
jgi:hypothetical protein